MNNKNQKSWASVGLYPNEMFSVYYSQGIKEADVNKDEFI